MLVLNDAINPVAYAFLQRDVKKEIKEEKKLRKDNYHNITTDRDKWLGKRTYVVPIWIGN